VSKRGREEKERKKLSKALYWAKNGASGGESMLGMVVFPFSISQSLVEKDFKAQPL
jgi:hypothetical protein